MISNIDRVHGHLALSRAILAIALVFALSCPQGIAQKTIAFDFEYQNNRYLGKIDADLLYQNASKIKTGEIEVKDFNEPFVIIFHNLDLDKRLDGQKLKLIIRQSDFDAEGGIQIEPNPKEKSIVAGQAPVRFPVIIKSEGKARIVLNRFFVVLPNGEEYQTQPAFPFNLSLNIKMANSAAVPPTVAETDSGNEDENAWKQNNGRADGLNIYLTKFNNGAHAEEAKRILANLIKSGNKDAAQVFLRHFPTDLMAKDAKALLDKKSPTEETAKPIAQEDPTRKEFDNIMKDGPSAEREDKLKTFIDNNPTSEWAEEAKKFVHTEPIIATDTNNSLNYKVRLKYALAPEVAFISDSNNVTVQIIYNEEMPVLDIALAKDSNFVVKLEDFQKSSDFAGIEIPLGNVLITTPLANTAEFLYGIRLSKGTPPFRMDFYNNNQRVLSEKIDRTDIDITFTLEELKKMLGNKTGHFEVSIKSSDGQLTHTGGSFEIPAKEIPWAMLIAAALAIVAIIGIARLRKSLRKKEFEKKIQKTANPHGGLNMGNLTENASPPISTHTAQITDAKQPTDKAPTMPMIIKNMKKADVQGKKRIVEEIEFLGIVHNLPFFKIDLTRLWPNTSISELYFSKNSILDLDRFIKSQNVHELKEHDGMIPEIGGFLLGRYHLSPLGVHRVAIEEFVPVTPHMHNVYKLEFSTAGIVQELGEAQDKFPNLALVAWFHTHPGHGLFLSTPDLTIHEGFFKEGYQFAMEIDSLSLRLDTGFFSRTTTGRVNNTSDLKNGAVWYEWAEIEKAARSMTHYDEQ